MITGSPSLRELCVNMNNFGDAGICSFIHQLENLTSLSVELCGFSVEGKVSDVLRLIAVSHEAKKK